MYRKRSEKGQALEAFGIIIAVVVVLAIILAVIGPSLPGIAKMTEEEFKKIPVNEHALERHGELAPEVKEYLNNCLPNNVQKFIGKGLFQDYELWACQFQETARVAIVVCVSSSECPRMITSFVSKNWKYIENLVKQGKYAPQ